jgi:hypothetical protein
LPLSPISRPTGSIGSTRKPVCAISEKNHHFPHAGDIRQRRHKTQHTNSYIEAKERPTTRPMRIIR